MYPIGRQALFRDFFPVHPVHASESGGGHSLVPTVPVGMPSATLCVVSLSTVGDSTRLTDGSDEYGITPHNDPAGSFADPAWFTKKALGSGLDFEL
jgi:hypothetical protein